MRKKRFSVQLYQGDCLTIMKEIPSGGVDMILCDLPYGMTHCRWDSEIPFDKLWEQYLRIIKENGVIALTACQPFTTKLISSQSKIFRYCWYWKKNMSTGFANAKKQPLRCIEEVCVFYKRLPIYNPQGIITLEKPIQERVRKKASHGDSCYRNGALEKATMRYITHYPKQLLEIKCERGLHPTQKPVELFEYMIRTYTKPGDIVMDNCMGSGTTGVACINTGREFIGMELDKYYFETAVKRIAEREKLCNAENASGTNSD